jgi:hypothetical protein
MRTTIGQKAAGLGYLPHPAQSLGLGLPSSLGHRLREVGEQHGEKEPDGDAPSEDARVEDGLDEGDHSAYEHHEHDRVPHLGPRRELAKGVDEGLAQDLAVEQPSRLGDSACRSRLGRLLNRGRCLHQNNP